MGAAASKRWRMSHPEKVAEQKRRYYLRSRDRLRDARNAKNKSRLITITRQAHAALGLVCVRCGFSDPRAIQIDHINGGGGSDRRRFINRDQFLKSVIKQTERFQLLYANCNCIKRHENGEFGSGRLRLKTTSAITED